MASLRSSLLLSLVAAAVMVGTLLPLEMAYAAHVRRIEDTGSDEESSLGGSENLLSALSELSEDGAAGAAAPDVSVPALESGAAGVAAPPNGIGSGIAVQQDEQSQQETRQVSSGTLNGRKITVVSNKNYMDSILTPPKKLDWEKYDESITGESENKEKQRQYEVDKAKAQVREAEEKQQQKVRDAAAERSQKDADERDNKGKEESSKKQVGIDERKQKLQQSLNQQNKEVEERREREKERANELLISRAIPQQNVRMEPSRVPFGTDQTYMFWIRPLYKQSNWASVIHKGGHDGQRDPAIWFYPSSSRLTVRYGGSNNYNEGCDPPNELPMHRWTHVAVFRRPNVFNVYYNGLLVCQNPSIGIIRNNEGPLWVGDPWYPSHNAIVCDLRYARREYSAEQVKLAIEDDKAAHRCKFAQNPWNKMPSVCPHDAVNDVLVNQVLRTQQSRALVAAARLPSSIYGYSYTFWLRPLFVIGGWSNIFHKGNNDNERNPAAWFYPGSLRLHVRAGEQRQGWNSGCDPATIPVQGQWTHVGISVEPGRMVVYLDGKAACTDINRAIMIANNGPLWVSNPWYAAGNADICKMRYTNCPLRRSEVEKFMQEDRAACQ